MLLKTIAPVPKPGGTASVTNASIHIRLSVDFGLASLISLQFLNPACYMLAYSTFYRDG
jgi:hypothetical protein